MSFNLVSLLCNKTNANVSGQLGILLKNPNEKGSYDYTNLKEKFDICYNLESNLLTKMLCSKILNNIKQMIQKEKNIENLPKTLFSKNILHFAIEEGSFFENKKNNFTRYNLCNLLMGYNNYFSIQYIEKYHDLFMLHGDRLYDYLNRMLMTYVVLTDTECEIAYNYCNLLSDAYSFTKIVEHKKDIMKIGYKIFNLFYNGLSHMIEIDSSTIDIYQKGYQMVTHNNNSYLQSLLDHKNKYITMIQDLNKHNRFVKYLDIMIDDIDLNNDYITLDIVDVIPCLLIRETYIGVRSYEEFCEKIKPVVIKILKGNKIPIEHKLGIISSFEPYFKKENTKLLIKLFLDLESHPEKNKRIKFRSKILNILKDIYDSSYSLEIDNFISIYTQHIIDILENITIAINEYKNSSNNMSKLIIIKYLLNLEKSFPFIEKLYKQYNTELFYFKVLELYYSFFKITVKNNIHSQLTLFHSTNEINYVPKSFSKTLDSIFINIYKIYNKLIEDKEFISVLIDNQYFYDKSIIESLRIPFGHFIVDKKNNITLITIFNKLEKDLPKFIKEFEKNKPQYDSDIPDEFKDPILLNCIKNAIEIPGVQQIVDKYTIYNHLFFNKTNPFTNEELTIKDLDNYNLKKEVQERIADFNKRFSKWKEEHIIKLC